MGDLVFLKGESRGKEPSKNELLKHYAGDDHFVQKFASLGAYFKFPGEESSVKDIDPDSSYLLGRWRCEYGLRSRDDFMEINIVEGADKESILKVLKGMVTVIEEGYPQILEDLFKGPMG